MPTGNAFVCKEQRLKFESSEEVDSLISREFGHRWGFRPHESEDPNRNQFELPIRQLAESLYI